MLPQETGHADDNGAAGIWFRRVINFEVGLHSSRGSRLGRDDGREGSACGQPHHPPPAYASRRRPALANRSM